MSNSFLKFFGLILGEGVVMLEGHIYIKSLHITLTNISKPFFIGPKFNSSKISISFVRPHKKIPISLILCFFLFVISFGW